MEESFLNDWVKKCQVMVNKKYQTIRAFTIKADEVLGDLKGLEARGYKLT